MDSNVLKGPRSKVSKVQIFNQEILTDSLVLRKFVTGIIPEEGGSNTQIKIGGSHE